MFYIWNAREEEGGSFPSYYFDSVSLNSRISSCFHPFTNPILMYLCVFLQIGIGMDFQLGWPLKANELIQLISLQRPTQAIIQHNQLDWGKDTKINFEFMSSFPPLTSILAIFISQWHQNPSRCWCSSFKSFRIFLRVIKARNWVQTFSTQPTCRQLYE